MRLGRHARRRAAERLQPPGSSAPLLPLRPPSRFFLGSLDPIPTWNRIWRQHPATQSPASITAVIYDKLGARPTPALLAPTTPPSPTHTHAHARTRTLDQYESFTPKWEYQSAVHSLPSQPLSIISPCRGQQAAVWMLIVEINRFKGIKAG